jgi:hypothetical protein
VSDASLQRLLSRARPIRRSVRVALANARRATPAVVPRWSDRCAELRRPTFGIAVEPALPDARRGHYRTAFPDTCFGVVL